MKLIIQLQSLHAGELAIFAASIECLTVSKALEEPKAEWTDFADYEWVGAAVVEPVGLNANWHNIAYIHTYIHIWNL